MQNYGRSHLPRASLLSPTDIAGSEALSDAVNTLSAQIAQSIKHLREALGTAAKLRRAPMTTLSSD